MPSRVEWRERALLPYKGTRRAPRPIAVVDIETDGLGGRFLAGGFCSERNPESVTFFTNVDEWVRAFFSRAYRGHVWYAHNGGEYDYKYLLRALCDKHPDIPVRIIPQGTSGRTIGAKFRHRQHSYELRDSWALAPMSLEKLLQAFNPGGIQKGKLDFEHECFTLTNPEHAEYLRKDCAGLCTALVNLRAKLTETFDVPVGWTAGGTALKAWRRTFAPGTIYWRGNAEREEFCRRAYHGGLVTLSSAEREYHVVDVDVNAMYAHSMRQGVPCGSAFWTDTEIDDCPGVYHVTAHVPYFQPFTFLPYRHELLHCLCWPTGDFETTITSVELQAARDVGIEVDVHEGICWQRIDYPFADFVDRCEELELQARDQNSGIKTIAKLMRNSLYGKLGARDRATTYIYRADGESPGEGWGIALDTLTGLPTGMFQREEPIYAPYIHPEWAAWITAQARVILSRFVYACGPAMCYYTDTYSLMESAEAQALSLLPFGRRYGELKRVHDFAWFHAGGPKNYLAKREDGNYVDCLKGIPRRAYTPEQHAASLAGLPQTISFQSMNATRLTLDGGKPFVQERFRRMSTLESARGWRRGADGRVRPLHVV